MNKFSQRVEELLHTEDTPLYKALQMLFTKTGTGFSQSSWRNTRDGSGSESFHKFLKPVLHSHVQKMFVGEILTANCVVQYIHAFPSFHAIISAHMEEEPGVYTSMCVLHTSSFQVCFYISGNFSMEVLCYIWDQCFMGLDVPEYQCLPYFTTVWLILLRDRLLKATSV